MKRIIALVLAFTCTVTAFGQGTGSTEELVRRVADHILVTTSFKFVNDKTKETFTSTKGLVPSGDR